MDMLTKENVIKTINQLQVSFSIDKLFDQKILLNKIEKRIAQYYLGQINTTKEAKIKLKNG